MFSWAYEDMPGIDPRLSVHQLNINLTSKPVKQKKINFSPKRNWVVVEEVEKLLKAQFIREVHYPEWLANVVMVRKPNRK